MVRCLIALVLLGLIAPGGAEAPQQSAAPAYQVPFRLTDTMHVMVRARINGQGPYHFIMDTGAPALFVATAPCKKLKIEADADGWGTFDRFEIEGGAVIEKIKGKIEDPFQLEGMNKMGLAGAELHGVLGYNLLARFRIELDFAKDKMIWTPLKFDPGLPDVLGGKTPAGVDAMAGLAKVMGTLLAKKGGRAVKQRGFLGIEFAERKEGIVITAVLKDSPAAEVGLKIDDRLTQVQGQEVKTTADLQRLTNPLTTGEMVQLTIARGTESRQVTVPLGKGF